MAIRTWPEEDRLWQSGRCEVEIKDARRDVLDVAIPRGNLGVEILGVSAFPVALELQAGSLEAQAIFVTPIPFDSSLKDLERGGSDVGDEEFVWEGARIGAPLEKAPWGDTFGMLTDKFGIHWMVNIAEQK